MIRERHAEAFSLAKNHLAKALILLDKKCCDDCLAAELKLAHNQLDQQLVPKLLTLLLIHL